MMKEMKGVCFLFIETGTEGGWWAMREDGLAEGDGDLRSLEDGDEFTVYADDNSVLFHGIIHQDTTTGAVPRRVLHDGTQVLQQVVGGMWVHWIQKGLDPEAWGQLFVGNKRCLLRREESAARAIAELKADIDRGSVGIASREAYKKRTIAIANGENVPEGEPKVWVESLGTLSQARSALLDRLKHQPAVNVERSTRDELYEEVSDEAIRSARFIMQKRKNALRKLAESSDDQLAADLGAPGCPGFGYLSGGLRRDPAEVLLDALDRDNLDARTIEALPWLPLRYPQMNWPWLVAQAKLCNCQSRLGFVVNLSARSAVVRAQRSVAESLYKVVAELRKGRLVKVDTLCQAWWPPSQRRYAHENRSRVATYWNLDTQLTEKNLAYEIDPTDR